MRRKRRMAAAAACVLAAAVCMGATLALLSARSGTLENTFTVGTGYVPGDDGQSLKLDEEKLGGKDGERTETGNDYTGLLPGASVKKDPSVYLTGGSVESYVFLRVEGADALEAVKTDGPCFTIEGWDSTYWVKVANLDKSPLTDADSGKKDGIYAANRKDIVDVSEEAEGAYIPLGTTAGAAVPLFTGVTMNRERTELPTGVLPEIRLRACAVQAAYTTFDEALEAAVF